MKSRVEQTSSKRILKKLIDVNKASEQIVELEQDKADLTKQLDKLNQEHKEELDKLTQENKKQQELID